MKKQILLFVFLLPVICGAQNLYFPPTTGTQWDSISASSLGWCANYIDTLNDYLDGQGTDAFILLKDGKIVHEKYFGTFTADSSHAWNSAGKTMTAFAVGLAQQENFLNVNDKTSDYLGTGWTVAPQAKEDLITVKHQLSMNAGLNDTFLTATCTDDTCLTYLADAGTRWSYHNAPYTLLQQVIQNATGVSANTYIFQKLFSSTGIAGAFIPILYNRVFYSKPRRMARFGLLMNGKGNWAGTQIMTDTNYFNEMITPSQSLNNSYGYLWWLNGQSSYMLPGIQTPITGKIFPDAPDDVYAALGKNDQLLVICPSKNIVFVRMGASGNAGFVGTAMTNDIWKILNKLMCAPNSVAEIKREINLQVYPNPFTNKFSIRSGEILHNANLQVLNSLGQVVYKEEKLSGIKFEIDITNFVNGLYTLELSEGSKVSRVKVVKR
jgi:CubicO group peptidase (beta-lactamase class C family)